MSAKGDDKNFTHRIKGNEGEEALGNMCGRSTNSGSASQR